MGTSIAQCCGSDGVEKEMNMERYQSQQTAAIQNVIAEVVKLQKKFETLSVSLQERNAEIIRLNSKIEDMHSSFIEVYYNPYSL